MQFREPAGRVGYAYFPAPDFGPGRLNTWGRPLVIGPSASAGRAIPFQHSPPFRREREQPFGAVALKLGIVRVAPRFHSEAYRVDLMGPPYRALAVRAAKRFRPPVFIGERPRASV
jgi:hypothetical protein